MFRITTSFRQSIRWLSQSPVLRARDKVAENKKKNKQLQKLKKIHKTPPQKHPLYMEVPEALRYLRAAAVGQPASSATISIYMTVVPEKGSKPISGSIFFPNPLKQSKILVLTSKSEVQKQALAAGATNVGGLELMEEIAEGKVPLIHDRAYATPEMVSQLGRYARLLGPKGLMPMVKKGTVTDNVVDLIKENLGSLPFKQKGYNLAVPVGRCDFSDKQILENLEAASKAIYGTQNSTTVKPNLLGQTVLTCNKGPGIVIDFKP